MQGKISDVVGVDEFLIDEKDQIKILEKEIEELKQQKIYLRNEYYVYKKAFELAIRKITEDSKLPFVMRDYYKFDMYKRILSYARDLVLSDKFKFK